MSLASVCVRVSVGRPNMPVGPVAVFEGSSMSLGVLDLPRTRFGCSVTGCSVSVTNADGDVLTIAAKRDGAVWTATFPSSHFASAGRADNGLQIAATGKDENGVERAWIVGEGDVRVLPSDATATVIGERHGVRLVGEKGAAPLAGDLYHGGDEWEIYDGEEWVEIGGGSGGGVTEEQVREIVGEEIPHDDGVVERAAAATTSTQLANGTAPKTYSDIHAEIAAKQDELTDDQKGVLNGGPYLTIDGDTIKTSGFLQIIGDDASFAVGMVPGGFVIDSTGVIHVGNYSRITDDSKSLPTYIDSKIPYSFASYSSASVAVSTGESATVTVPSGSSGVTISISAQPSGITGARDTLVYVDNTGNANEITIGKAAGQTWQMEIADGAELKVAASGKALVTLTEIASGRFFVGVLKLAVADA